MVQFPMSVDSPELPHCFRESDIIKNTNLKNVKHVFRYICRLELNTAICSSVRL